jgi:hypothetical protein
MLVLGCSSSTAPRGEVGAGARAGQAAGLAQAGQGGCSVTVDGKESGDGARSGGASGQAGAETAGPSGDEGGAANDGHGGDAPSQGAAGDGGGAGGARSDADACICTDPSDSTAVVSLDCLCQDGCPDLASEQVPAPTCYGGLVDSHYERRGCGRVQFDFMTFFEQSAYEFDTATGELMGALRRSDEGWGACKTTTYIAGDYGDLSVCPDYVECLNCVTDVDNNPTPLCSTIK